jgi:hypothetical protein
MNFLKKLAGQSDGSGRGARVLAAPHTRSLLIDVLRDCLGRDSGALYQTILALEALGENLYGPRSSTSCDEVERNERVAREYLSSQSSEAANCRLAAVGRSGELFVPSHRDCHRRASWPPWLSLALYAT